MSMFPKRCRHRWVGHRAQVTEVFGQEFLGGGLTKLPVRTYTDVSGTCADCQEPLHKRIEGHYTLPADRAPERGQA